MYQKWLKKDFYILKLELLTTLVPKFGKTIPTITKAIFGHWVVSFMKQLHLNLLLELRTCKVSTKKF